jgi:hypothetical protein
MTWVIGASSVFGVGLLVSDIRVSLRNGQRRDMLRKVYALGPYIGVGFAGSVACGFAIWEVLQSRYSVATPPGKTYEPEAAAVDIQRIAREVFMRQPAAERDVGCQLLLVGCSFKRDMGWPGATPIAIIRMVAPHFVPHAAKRDLFAALHIGSGSKVREYKRLVRTYFREPGATISMQASEGWSQMMALSLSLEVSDHPVDGVSPHLHFMTIRKGQIALQTNEVSTTDMDGTETRRLKMPKIAENYSAFVEMVNAAGNEAGGAIA